MKRLEYNLMPFELTNHRHTRWLQVAYLTTPNAAKSRQKLQHNINSIYFTNSHIHLCLAKKLTAELTTTTYNSKEDGHSNPILVSQWQLVSNVGPASSILLSQIHVIKNT